MQESSMFKFIALKAYARKRNGLKSFSPQPLSYGTRERRSTLKVHLQKLYETSHK